MIYCNHSKGNGAEFKKEGTNKMVKYRRISVYSFNNGTRYFDTPYHDDVDGRKIIATANKYGRANDVVSIIDEDGKLIAQARWSVSERAYYKAKI